MIIKYLSSQEAVQHILDLPSGSEMSDLDDQFSKDEIDLDICNKNAINIEENKEENIENNNNDEDIEVQNNQSNESQMVMMGAKNKMIMRRINLEIKGMMNKGKKFSKETLMPHI